MEQALAMYREMRRAAAVAPDGEALNVAESLAVTRGRELMRRSLQTVLEEETAEIEKKRAGQTLRVRRGGRTSRQASAVDRHGGRRGEVATRLLRLLRLPRGSARRGCATRHCGRTHAPSGALSLPGRRELAVRASEQVSCGAERFEGFSEHGAQRLSARSAARRGVASGVAGGK